MYGADRANLLNGRLKEPIQGVMSADPSDSAEGGFG
jgi:hypothetical protein